QAELVLDEHAREGGFGRLVRELGEDTRTKLVVVLAIRGAGNDLMPRHGSERELEIETDRVALFVERDLLGLQPVVRGAAADFARMDRLCPTRGYIRRVRVAHLREVRGIGRWRGDVRNKRRRPGVEFTVLADDRQMPALAAVPVVTQAAKAAVPAVGGVAQVDAVVVVLLIAGICAHAPGFAGTPAVAGRDRGLKFVAEGDGGH